MATETLAPVTTSVSTVALSRRGDGRPITPSSPSSAARRGRCRQVRKIAAIVRADPLRRFVVVSAPGKRNPQDKKITDLLYLCHSLGAQGLDAGAPFAVIKERYLGIAEELGVEGAWEWLRDVQQQIRGGAAEDWVASRGEYLSARIIAAFLEAEFVDAVEGIRFGEDGRFHASETYARLHERLARVPEGKIAVLPGFYGQDAQGRIKTFSRGGSDVTGAIVARAVQAAVYENWTDVSGMLMADPRLVDGPVPIAEITYREQRELSYMGASVLHAEAVFPVREAGIPIHIRNTDRPDDPGTRIVRDRDAHDSPIVGIAGRTGFATIFTEKALMNQERGYGRRVLEVLEAHGISYEHSPTSIDTLSVIVADEELGGQEAERRGRDPPRRPARPDRGAARHRHDRHRRAGHGASGRRRRPRLHGAGRGGHQHPPDQPGFQRAEHHRRRCRRRLRPSRPRPLRRLR